MTNNSTTAIAHHRIPGLDVARGLAIFGMIVVHFLLVLQPNIPSSFLTLDLLDGRPTMLFMLLAGIGLTLMSRRPDSGLDVKRLAWKRGTVLLLLGMVNLILWPGDILRVYGVVFLLSSVLLARHTLGLLAVSSTFMAGFMVLLFAFDYGKHWDWHTLTYHGLWTASGVVRNLFFDGFRSVFPWAGVLVLGMALGRLPLRDRRVQHAAIGIGAALWIGVELLSFVLLRGARSQEWIVADPELSEITTALLGTSSLPPQLFFLASALGLAAVLLGCCLRVSNRWAETLPIRALKATGQMAFTWYLAHIYLGAFVLVAIGWQTTNEAMALGIAGAYFATVAGLSLWWRSTGRRGPLEALMRRLTHPRPTTMAA